MRLVKASGWRWWNKSRSFFISFGTDIYWFHMGVGPFSVAVERSTEHAMRKFFPEMEEPRD